LTDNQTAGQDLKTTPLDALHRELGAKMVPFAGYDMPVQYETGIIAEHNHTRSQASLFDVSHMGQAQLSGDDAAAALETLVPGDIEALTAGKIRYTALTNDAGGIMDDLMVTHGGDHLFLVVNAGNKDADFAHIREHIGDRTELNIMAGRALVALQGPQAAKVLSRLAPEAGNMQFMTAETLDIGGVDCFVTRSGYSGEDGYEISIPGEAAEDVTQRLLGEDEVLPAGLGARDSLRLEAGLCLHGNDIDATTTPIEASLIWTISKRRRAEGGFPGAAVVQDQIANGAPRKLVGILPEGRAPARAHTEITDAGGETVGEVTSGGFGPSVGGPVAMGYVRSDLAKIDTPLNLIVRGKALPAKVIKLPFVPHRYFNG
jgi:aminomethyltransferase